MDSKIGSRHISVYVRTIRQRYAESHLVDQRCGTECAVLVAVYGDMFGAGDGIVICCAVSHVFPQYRETQAGTTTVSTDDPRSENVFYPPSKNVAGTSYPSVFSLSILPRCIAGEKRVGGSRGWLPPLQRKNQEESIKERRGQR